MRRFTPQDHGFTLIELMLVVGVVGILAAVALVSYRHFTKRAQSVEAEVALTEVHRLQQQYHAQHGSYAADLAAVGFNPIPPLKYYAVNVRYVGGRNGVAYQLYAVAKENGEGSVAMVLTQFQDGRVELDKSVVVAGGIGQPGNGSSGTGMPSDAVGTSSGSLGDDPLDRPFSGSNSTSSSSSRTVIHQTNSLGVSGK
ncbi:MAG: prepilin-type N-terminal cleavage/methylation domain-containing protein [Nitrospira sp.]